MISYQAYAVKLLLFIWMAPSNPVLAEQCEETFAVWMQELGSRDVNKIFDTVIF